MGFGLCDFRAEALSNTYVSNQHAKRFRNLIELQRRRVRQGLLLLEGFNNARSGWDSLI